MTWRGGVNKAHQDGGGSRFLEITRINTRSAKDGNLVGKEEEEIAVKSCREITRYQYDYLFYTLWNLEEHKEGTVFHVHI